MSDNETSEARRLQLVDRYSKRADEAANYFRAVLFALATVSNGFLISKNYGASINPHIISIFLFAVAIVLIVYSWDYQKAKSLLRVNALESENGLKNFQQLQSDIASRGKNQTIDRWTAGFVFSGFAVELVLMIACRGL
ncbi:MAG TPA: hypothetical protein VIM38_00825 [Alphaproteobacteria bacterium]